MNKKPNAAQRKTFMTELAAILAAEPWAEDAMPVTFTFARATWWQRRTDTWWGSIRTGANSARLGGYISVEFGNGDAQSQTAHVVRRLKAWSEGAWNAGIRRTKIVVKELPSAHEVLAAEAVALTFDRPVAGLEGTA